jgi:hypothetical protein
MSKTLWRWLVSDGLPPRWLGGALVLALVLPIGLVLPGVLLVIAGKVLVSVGGGMEAVGSWWIEGVDWLVGAAWSLVSVW